MNFSTQSTTLLDDADSTPAYHTPCASAQRSCAASPWKFMGTIALCIGLSSCFASYSDGGYGHNTSYRPGYRVNALPGGYRSEIISGNTYYYHDGHYYRPSSGGYIIVDAPRTSRYYDDYGRRHQSRQTYRRSDRHSSSNQDQTYEREVTLTRLPRGYREVTHRGTRYYQVDDRFYQRQNNTYVMVQRPY